MDYKNAYHHLFNSLMDLSVTLEHPTEGTEAIDVPKLLTHLLSESEKLLVNSSTHTRYKASRSGSSRVKP